MTGRRRIAWVLALVAVVLATAACEAVVAPSAELLPTVPVVTVAGDASQFILQVPNGGCGSHADIDYVAPDLGLVDRRIDANGGRVGLVAAPRQAFFGPLAAAGAAFGGSQVVVGKQDVWIRTPDGATQLLSFVTPRGRTIWMTGDVASRAACPPA